FVLPMNPPRAELDNAVRLIFAGHGISIKKSRFLERGAGLSRSRLDAAEEPLSGSRPAARGSGGALPAAEGARKRRNRSGRPRRRRSSPGPETQT
ncbi:MAG: polynucleotide adenylyltransferase PcnB, partial [Treponema sp.]|nr:polynucleotide adenylyltransferase PcnB [Treponema sp.]